MGLVWRYFDLGRWCILTPIAWCLCVAANGQIITIPIIQGLALPLGYVAPVLVALPLILVLVPQRHRLEPRNSGFRRRVLLVLFFAVLGVATLGAGAFSAAAAWVSEPRVTPLEVLRNAILFSGFALLLASRWGTQIAGYFTVLLLSLVVVLGMTELNEPRAWCVFLLPITDPLPWAVAAGLMALALIEYLELVPGARSA